MWSNVIKNNYLSQNVTHMLGEPSLLHCEMVDGIKSGKNMMVISANNADKRIGYLAAIIDMLLEIQHFGKLSVPIVVSVRELCKQIYMKAKHLLFQIKDLTVIRLYQKMEELIDTNILICTPGTLKKN
uniref:Helicase ATP-binding domain-containing protein n=1 Tax=Strongyloides venezuelensis TaxID=75913 RepID=A0A0K0FEP5_STRVS